MADPGLRICQPSTHSVKNPARRSHQKHVAGRGYPLLVAGNLLYHPAATGLQILNCGVNGDNVSDLQNRWQEDCLDLKPDLVSILIDVNDIWHRIDEWSHGFINDDYNNYRDLLHHTRQHLPETKIVICEPFLLRYGRGNHRWFPHFDQCRAAAARLAAELNVTLVPFQTVFSHAVMESKMGPEYWADDGVHPTLAGHSLMAKA
ncbi:MAG: GDSL-type esterase/lipase family protein [Fuerstiella sp.]|nr:GDSL-type esterase/lipase family protein [Fuerstiella sp.]